MRKKNGFFSMSLIYSFFLVFVLISAILLANYAHNRLLTKNFNDDIKENLNDRGERKLINLRNKVQNSNFESDSISNQDYQWILENAAYASNQMYLGERSIALNSNGENKITQHLAKNIIKEDHEYFFQYAYFTAGQEVDFNDYQILIRNNSSKVYYFQNLNNSNLNSPNWVVEGFTITTNDLNEDDDWYLEIVKTGASSNPLYIDAILLTDLTQAYGYSDEPTIEWLNDNIEYFESNYIYQRNSLIK